MTVTKVPPPSSNPTADETGRAAPEDHPPSCGDLVGALAEPDRCAAFAALVLGARSVKEVAEAARLKPPAAAGALQRLTDSGLVTLTDARAHTYEVTKNVFRKAIRTEERVAGKEGGDGAGAYFRRGRLRAIPGDDAVRARVLRVVADSFRPGETYSEAKVNALCGEWLDDWVSLRRALIDEGLLRRDATGTRYERV
ncbi:DUF2087 domain-containing protein [Streptomyces orinoci]|uniref:DUF2087 domain-containing protein n=1 Tax=Streptomyces orinoci TaxID=67339 RepID=UPI003BACF5C3